jgi:hypothetical protein
MAGIGRRGFYGVSVSGGGTGAVAEASDREPAEEWFENRGEKEVGEGVPLKSAVDGVDRRGWAVWGVVVVCRDTIELFACVDKGGGHTDLTHVLGHNAVVCGVEGSFDVGVHDVDVLVVYFGVIYHDGGEGVMDAA